MYTTILDIRVQVACPPVAEEVLDVSTIFDIRVRLHDDLYTTMCTAVLL